MILWHGTTRDRAEQIVRQGPDPYFCEPGSVRAVNGFSTNLAIGPFLFGRPEVYALGKAKEFPNEGGPAILEIDVPEDVVQKAVNEWFPLEQGLVQFDLGSGLEELLANWPLIQTTARIRQIS